MANRQRQRRVADQIQRELAEILRLELKDPRIGMITLTDVEMSPDLTHARVFFTLMESDEVRAETERALLRASGFLRHQLGQRLSIHNTPSLQFIYDGSVERGMRLSQLIDDAVSEPPVPDSEQ